MVAIEITGRDRNRMSASRIICVRLKRAVAFAKKHAETHSIVVRDNEVRLQIPIEITHDHNL